MGIAFRAAADNSGGSSSGSLVINKPTGTVDNDVMLAIINLNDATDSKTIAPPAGWSNLYDDFWMSSGGCRVGVYYKVASSEGSSYEFTFSSTGACGGAIASYSGCDTATPIDVSSSNDDTTSDTSAVATSVTTTGTNRMIVALFAIDGANTVTPPSGMTERADNGTNKGVSIHDVAQAAAGASGNKTATTVDPLYSAGFLVALKEPSAASNFFFAHAA